MIIVGARSIERLNWISNSTYVDVSYDPSDTCLPHILHEL